MQMLRTPTLNIPETLPEPKAIQSFGDNKHSYDPHFWELDYKVQRYLQRLSNEDLAERYKYIVYNMTVLINKERDVIPIQSFLSSWYWFRKEHQTRLEFALRDMPIPVDLQHRNTEINKVYGAPTRPKHPNAGDMLFRYDKRHYIEKIANEGQIRIRPAADFRTIEGDAARNDEECSKKSFISGSNTRVIHQSGKEIPVLGNIEHVVSLPNYYIFCMACDWDPTLFIDFDADACIVIKDVELFARRIELAAKPQLPDWYFHHNPIHYFDPFERMRNEQFDAGMCKHFRFAYQREYRFLWLPQNNTQPDGFKFLELGNLSSMAEIHYADLRNS